MPIHDVECTKCGTVIRNYFSSPWPSTLLHEDGGELVILWQAASSRPASVHPRERTVVFRNPTTGEISYPARNNAPTKPGWERVEFEHTRDRERFEKEQGVICEQGWYNSGNGV